MIVHKVKRHTTVIKRFPLKITKGTKFDCHTEVYLKPSKLLCLIRWPSKITQIRKSFVLKKNFWASLFISSHPCYIRQCRWSILLKKFFFLNNMTITHCIFKWDNYFLIYYFTNFVNILQFLQFLLKYLHEHI